MRVNDQSVEDAITACLFDSMKRSAELPGLQQRRDDDRSEQALDSSSAQILSGATVNEAHWEHFKQEDDLGIKGYGPTKADAFEQAAIAMTAAISDPKLLQSQSSVKISCKANNDELLLIHWLTSLAYEMATRRMLFSQFDVQISDGQLHATAWGEPIDPEWHHPAVEIKGVLLRNVRVAEEGEGRWGARCVIEEV